MTAQSSAESCLSPSKDMWDRTDIEKVQHTGLNECEVQVKGRRLPGHKTLMVSIADNHVKVQETNSKVQCD